MDDELSVHKVLGASSVERSYKKKVRKDNRIVEDLQNGVGVYMTYTEVIDGFYDIYIAATVQNSEGTSISSLNQV